ncbi:uncharacterized protein LOC111618029 [Centruroides sculpturatus]|uniref:uncharacterized protein LOC111618029 n=1 Tax=Centruroides sculpturatus TaxID=218467 RepID=UPI000C6E183E|nr:uncharacterized protein LOC111618029 [Centruroides sculpturatus]
MAKKPHVSESEHEVSSQGEMELVEEDERVKIAESIHEEVKNYMTENHKCKLGTGEHISYVCGQIDRLIELLRQKPTNQLQDAVESLHKKIDKVLQSKESTGPSYAQVTAQKITRPRKKILLVDPENDNTDAENTKQKLKKNINPKEMGIGIQAVCKLKRGGVAIEVGSAEEKNKLKEVIESKIGLKTREPFKRKPRIILYGVGTEVSREEILECLYEQNEIINSNMTETEFRNKVEVRFQFGSKGKQSTNWVIQVSPDVRRLILKVKKINLGWSRCGAEDHISVTQCFQCCRIGHIAKDCQEKAPICSQCGQSHKYKDYTHKEKAECVNCKREKIKDFKHNACSKNCPLIQKVKKMLIAKTDYGE